MRLKTSNGIYFYVDDEDAEKVSAYKWWGYIRNGKVTSVFRNKNKTTFRLTEFLLGRKDGFQIDHINRKPVDNRKENLRFVTFSQNMCNKGPANTYKGIKKRTKYKGVYFNKKDKLYIASLRKDHKYFYIGCFKKEIDAVKAYNKASKKYHGEFGYQNEIEGKNGAE